MSIVLLFVALYILYFKLLSVEVGYFYFFDKLVLRL